MMIARESDSPSRTRFKDGHERRIGGDAEIAWIAQSTDPGAAITRAVPAVYACYCTLMLPEGLPGAQRRHDHAVIELLRGVTQQQPWWLGYLDVGIGADVVFYDAPRVKVYEGWEYVLIQAGPEQAASWRDSEGPRSPWKGALPDLMFPADRSWFFSTLWDDHWSSIGGPHSLIDSFGRDPELGSRTTFVDPEDDGTAQAHRRGIGS
jgi:hypothetical protein